MFCLNTRSLKGHYSGLKLAHSEEEDNVGISHNQKSPKMQVITISSQTCIFLCFILTVLLMAFLCYKSAENG